MSLAKMQNLDAFDPLPKLGEKVEQDRCLTRAEIAQIHKYEEERAFEHMPDSFDDRCARQANVSTLTTLDPEGFPHLMMEELSNLKVRARVHEQTKLEQYAKAYGAGDVVIQRNLHDKLCGVTTDRAYSGDREGGKSALQGASLDALAGGIRGLEVREWFFNEVEKQRAQRAVQACMNQKLDPMSFAQAQFMEKACPEWDPDSLKAGDLLKGDVDILWQGQLVTQEEWRQHVKNLSMYERYSSEPLKISKDAAKRWPEPKPPELDFNIAAYLSGRSPQCR